MKNRFTLPPLVDAPAGEGAEAAYLAERERAQGEKILASMELRLNGRPNAERRHVLTVRPARADSAYDPRRW